MFISTVFISTKSSLGIFLWFMVTSSGYCMFNSYALTTNVTHIEDNGT